MKYLLSAATAAAMACAFAPTAAHAGDYKVYHGSDCKVFGATAWTDLNFTGFGVKNIAASARNVICPIIKDSGARWDADAVSPTNYAYVHAHVRNESGVTSTSVCTVYVTALNDTSQYNAYTMSFTNVPSGSDWNLSTNYLVSVGASLGWDHDKAYMLCALAPGARLTGYYLYEGAGAE